MRKIIFILFVLGTSIPVTAQEELKKADLYFSRAYYSDAIPLYEALLPRNKSSQLIKNLADCYYHTFDMKAAARWYDYLIANYGNNVDESYFFKLNQSLKATGAYDEADKVLIDFYTKNNQVQKTNQVHTERTYIDNVKAIGERFTVTNLPLNTGTSEFGAARVDSVLIYSAARKEINSLSKVYRWNNQSYLDMYTHPIGQLQLSDTLSVPLSKNINSKLHEGTFAITKDRKTLYFTRNSKKKTEDDNISHLKIYKAEWIDGEWNNVLELPFNGINFSTEHPALNPDESKLYFASDREGGFGGFDIYYVTIQNNGAFGNPINLGNVINTEGKEQFPFLDEYNNLYFSSNGHPGFGLLDIFIATKQNDTYTKPDNIGLPINSGFDDFSFFLNKDNKTGYFASNRPIGKGSDDIYSFIESKPLIIEDCLQYIAGTITDRITNAPLANASIEIIKDDKSSKETLITATDGSFKFTVDCNTSYTLIAQKKGYENNSKIVLTNDIRKDIKDGSISLISLKEIEIQKAIVLQKEQEEAEKIKIAEINRKKEEEKKAKQEQIKKAEESKLKQAVAIEKAKKERQQKIEAAIAKEEVIVKEKDRTIIEIGEIHFDYSLWYLRRESRQRLDKVIPIMNSYPGMVLEIGTHTDIRGNKEYNRNLSQKRADAAKDYLVENGIDKSRVIAKGYGESKPIVECETEESCTEEDHEWNRRCELVVIKWE